MKWNKKKNQNRKEKQPKKSDLSYEEQLQRQLKEIDVLFDYKETDLKVDNTDKE